MDPPSPAELVFGHWALGSDARRSCSTRKAFRRAGRGSQPSHRRARSLEVLVPEEGRLLAARLVATWTLHAGRIDPAYAALPATTPKPARLKLLHLETFADLALLCLTWKPGGHGPGSSRKSSRSCTTKARSLTMRVLQQMLKTPQVEASYSLKLLAGFINDALGLDPSRSQPLNDRQGDEQSSAGLRQNCSPAWHTRLTSSSGEPRSGSRDVPWPTSSAPRIMTPKTFGPS